MADIGEMKTVEASEVIKTIEVGEMGEMGETNETNETQYWHSAYAGNSPPASQVHHHWQQNRYTTLIDYWQHLRPTDTPR
ncbi:hypothetical protein [Bifidobacterium sp. ESL0764]|uniref:hypothetical protein n=1 Tax=Bifidobacterium sp. ESL0764 TaxID=2983228 RepID=UPI0023F9BD16|nr:hypothetical protein [Bifidobacterium sp. ESL0764]WEV66029.1 hypothetical protein OZX71_01350 [Bifidobacterium sp. ESL0764]